MIFRKKQETPEDKLDWHQGLKVPGMQLCVAKTRDLWYVFGEIDDEIRFAWSDTNLEELMVSVIRRYSNHFVEKQAHKEFETAMAAADTSLMTSEEELDDIHDRIIEAVKGYAMTTGTVALIYSAALRAVLVEQLIPSEAVPAAIEEVLGGPLSEV